MTDATDEYRLYGYRWVVVALTMGVNLTMQMLWIAYAPITSDAARYYHVSTLAIGMLSMVFMIAFIPFSLPASWLIDSRGFHRAMGLGVILMGVFGIVRGLAGENYALVLLATTGIAIAQPLLLNSWTTVPAKWFGPRERATAVGLITLANLIGTALGLVLTPVLTGSLSIATVQLIYGVIASSAAAAFVLFVRERPATPPCPPALEERALMLAGLKHALKVRPFLVYLGVVFVGMGIFNGVTTWVEQIIKPRGFSSGDAGVLGALMLLGGLFGAVIIPAISDRRRKRIPYMVMGLALAIPGMLGLAFATSIVVLFGAAFALGFFLISVSPVGMQYTAEVTYPTPEGTSNGLIQLAGQSAVVFVYIMEAMRTRSGAFTPSLLLATALLAVAAVAVSRLKDVPPATAATGAAPEGPSPAPAPATAPTPD